MTRGNKELEIRKKLVDSDLIESIITLGEKLFYATGLSPCILILRRVKKADRVGKILMVDASKIFTLKSAQNELSDDNVNDIFNYYHDFSDVIDYSRIVSLQEIRDKEYELSVNRYVHYSSASEETYEEVKSGFDFAYNNMKSATEHFHDLLKKGGYIK